MKKLLVLMLSAGLVLGACGNNESKSEDKKQDVKSDSEKKKAEKQKEEKEKQEQKAKNEKAKKEKQAKDEQRKKDEELAQQNSQQTATQNEQTPVQDNVQQPVENNTQQEPTDQEKAEANAKVAKENGYTGIPNGDAHSDVPVGQIELSPDELAEEEAKPEYHNTVEPEEDDEPLEWVEDEDGNPTLKGGL
ncbi:hypothetical protein NGH74_13715 [Staphylococcus pseudoxylosus]|uniref:hypothetical protein n=1 Tax=Staphylococcus pseudoxylosus TaxID=2282419 RepID=UPI002DBB1208|nr:hypothetical protein [Staphylococcus pseudoxylosus]MEB8088218.1 hypothetical protein [Staphylococcus pseudoxylosus]